MRALKRYVVSVPRAVAKKTNQSVLLESEDLMGSFSDILIPCDDYLSAKPLERFSPMLVSRAGAGKVRLPDELETLIAESAIEHRH